MRRAFDEISTAVSSATVGETEAVPRLRAACAAYVDFATNRPNRSQLAFSARESATPFDLLVGAVDACIAAGQSDGQDPFGDATAIRVALHGYAVLKGRRPTFPWPPAESTLETIVSGIAGLPRESVLTS
jgi:hypothetical protein